jgi:hypothetical protein
MAQKLAAATLVAESTLSAGMRRMFASFEGMVKIDANQADHGQHNAHGAPGAHVAPAK